MAKIISDKHDALRYINDLYPIGQSDAWDNKWLQEINDFGIEKLPEKLLIRMANLMLENEGEQVKVPSQKCKYHEIPEGSDACIHCGEVYIHQPRNHGKNRN